MMAEMMKNMGGGGAPGGMDPNMMAEMMKNMGGDGAPGGMDPNMMADMMKNMGGGDTSNEDNVEIQEDNELEEVN